MLSYLVVAYWVSACLAPALWYGGKTGECYYTHEFSTCERNFDFNLYEVICYQKKIKDVLVNVLMLHLHCTTKLSTVG